MFIVCVTDTQPKECKGVLKRLMDVVTVDYGKPCDRLCDEGKGVWKEIIFSHCQDPHTEFEMQSYLQALYCKNLWMFHHYELSVLFSDYIWLEKGV